MRRAGVLVALVLFFVSFFGFTILTRAQEEVDSVWNTGVEVEDAGTYTHAEATTGINCDIVPVKARKLAGSSVLNPVGFPEFNQSQVFAEDIDDLCITRNSSGSFGGRYYSPTSKTSDMLQLVPDYFNGFSYRPAPINNMVVMSASLPQGKTISMNYNFEAIGRLGTIKKALLKHDFSWSVQSPAPQLRYLDDTNVYINGLEFSGNGEFMVLRLGNWFVKVDVDTQEMTPFYYRSSVSSLFSVAISSDGRYVVTSMNGEVFVHDTQNCTNSYSKRQWIKPVSTQFLGCEKSPNYYGKLLSEAPGFGIVRKLEFSSNDSEISLAFGREYQRFRYEWKKLSLSTSNFSSSNEGYLALGDSFSSGEGDNEGDVWYESGTDEQGNPDTFEGRNLCHLSRRSYPYLMAISLGYLANNLNSPPSDGLFHSVACSGAVTRNISGGGERGLIDYPANGSAFEDADNQYRNDYFENLDRWQPGRIKQLDFIDKSVFGGYTAPEKAPEVITVGIGGNDAGFGDIILSCIKPGTCKYAVEGSFATSELAQTIASLKDTLSETYKSVKSSSPEIRVYVHGYPVFVQGYGGNCGLNTPLNSEETILVEKGVRYMNRVVEAAAAEAGVFYVDVSDILQGRNLCSGVDDNLSAFNGATKGNDKLSLFDNKIAAAVSGYYMIGNNCYFTSGCIGNESFHPNHMGHELYAEEILNQTDNLTALMPESSPQPYPTPDSFFGNLAIEHIARVNESNGYITDYDVVIKQPKSFLSYKDQDTIAILQGGFYPGSTIVVSHQSEPTDIGQFIVGEEGVLQEKIILPQTLTSDPGDHEIHIEGLDSFGNPVNYYQPITIAFSAEDFDGDGIMNEVDSCVTLPNSSVDEDQDGIDDACDSEILLPIVEEELQQENDGFVGFEKGETNPETVAGNEEIINQGVLGDSDSQQVIAETNSLSNTGIASITVSLIGTLIISFVLFINTKKVVQG